LGELFDIFQAQHDLKNIGGVTAKFKSGVSAIWREIAHVTIIGSGSGYFSDPKIRSRCVICRARNRIQIFVEEAASNAWLAPDATKTRVRMRRLQLRCQHH
jgi:hypothetical protein